MGKYPVRELLTKGMFFDISKTLSQNIKASLAKLKEHVLDHLNCVFVSYMKHFYIYTDK